MRLHSAARTRPDDGDIIGEVATGTFSAVATARSIPQAGLRVQRPRELLIVPSCIQLLPGRLWRTVPALDPPQAANTGRLAAAFVRCCESTSSARAPVLKTSRIARPPPVVLPVAHATEPATMNYMPSRAAFVVIRIAGYTWYKTYRTIEMLADSPSPATTRWLEHKQTELNFASLIVSP